MSARLRSAALGIALAALACGGGEPDADPAAPPASEPAAAASDAPRPSPEKLRFPTPPLETAPNDEPDDRVGEILDTETTGAGLDELIRSAREEPSPAAREAAVIALGDSDDPRALDALIAASEDPDARVVLAALDQLSWIDDRRAEEAIRRLAESPNPEIAEAAREELEE